MDQTVAYNIIQEAKTIIMNSTTDIENTFRRMSTNISQDYAAEGGAALSGKAGQAIANAWSDLAYTATPQIKNELTVLTDKKLTEWGSQFGIAEDTIAQLFQQN